MTSVHAVEPGRLAALRRYATDDLPAEHELLALVRVAATVAGVRHATLNLLGHSVQTNYATHGFVGGSCALEDSLCVVALRERSRLHVPDLRLDPRFAANPWVDGRLDTVRLYASSPLMTDDGWMIGTLCAFDGTPGVLPAAALGALDDLAGQAMALLERRRLVRRAEEATRTKSAFLATVSHEIRTPMQGVLGGLDLVLREQLPEDVRRHASLARRSAGALLTLVDDVLQMSQGEAKALVLDDRPFDPAVVVADVADALRVLADRKGLELRAAVEPGVPASVVGDPDRVRQVLVNLVGNAVKFTPSGAVELTLSAVRAGETGEDVLLRMTVADSGDGIRTEDLPQLFTPFAQGDSGHRHGGSGLGLSICAQLAQLMGGRVEVASEHGVGSTFTFSLRLPVDAALPADAPAGREHLGGLRVLVADDSDVNRMIAVGLLEALGAQASAVGDGLAALDAVRAGNVDAVLLDTEMPELDGPSAARRIRALPPPLGRLPVFALTGRVSEDDRRTCLEAGMDGVLAKPLDPATLGRALAALPRRAVAGA